MESSLNAIDSGKGENKIVGVIFDTLIDQGCGFLGMEPFINTWPRTCSLHALWSGRKICSGEPVLIENQSQHQSVSRCVDANGYSLALGVAGAEGLGSGTIERVGLFERFRKRTGYSIGLAYAPDWGEGHLLSLQKGDPTVLAPGMTFHIPPALRERGKYGFGTSETILVTETGCEILTALPDRLIRR